MPRFAGVIGVLAALTACERSSDTGVHIVVHLGDLSYDELQFGVTRAGETVVDPASNGRYVGPFQPGDQDVVVYLPDDFGGSQLRCEVTALQAGEIAGQGAGDVTVVRGETRALEIFMGAAPVPGRANGEGCSLASECLTGHCTDGVCCESACQMACHSCALAESKGLCRPMADGTPDPHGMCGDKGAASCKTNGLCGASCDCAVYPAGTPCAPAECADMGRALVPDATCNGNGKCESPQKIECPDGTSCLAAACV